MNELTVKEQNITRTPEAIGSEIRGLTSTMKYMTMWYACEIGKRLTEAKELVGHGEWMDFLARETEFSSSGAGRMMQLYKEYGTAGNSNFPTLGNLSVSNALRLLAVPEEEREAFAAEVDAEHISTRELEAAIKAKEAAEAALEKANAEAGAAIERAEDAEKKASELSEENDRLMEDLADAEKQVKELESRPVDVAVQDHDAAPEQIEAAKAEARAEALAEAEQAHAAEIAELKSNKQAEVQRADMLAQKLQEAQKKLQEAEAGDAAEKDKLSAEVEQLKKQIAMSGAEITAFKLRFAAWQEAYNAMQTALATVPEDQRGKCEAAVKAVLEGWGNG